MRWDDEPDMEFLAAGRRAARLDFPEPGECFAEFELLALLGRGGMSRVFLARDLSLGAKLVALKIAPDRGAEARFQGALDHPHIVPVHSVAFDGHGLRGLSMPYWPGLPLDEVIRRIEPGGRPGRAIALWEAVVEGTASRLADLREPAFQAAANGVDGPCRPRGDGWDGFPARGSYTQGVAWIVGVLARTLDHAHRMRTFHRDVKPANVLLTLGHGPQLLDFSLAESPHSARGADAAALRGGTIPYMAPEQIEACLDPALWSRVRAPADIYSLGLVLSELLTGESPDLPDDLASPASALPGLLDRRAVLDVAVRHSNAAIPKALEAILVSCLAFSPHDRYPDARALADDLSRFLKRRPFRDWIDLCSRAFGETDPAPIRRPTVLREKTNNDQAPPDPPMGMRRRHPLWDRELDG